MAGSKVGDMNGWWAFGVKFEVAMIPIFLYFHGLLLARFGQLDAKVSVNQTQIWQIREDLAALPSRLPPVWFVSRVDKLEDRLKLLEQLLLNQQQHNLQDPQ